MSWEDSYDNWKTTPPDEPDVFAIDLFGNEIYPNETYYDINGVIISEDSLDECVCFANHKMKCELCGNYIEEDEKAYRIDGSVFCEECLTDCQLEADE